MKRLAAAIAGVALSLATSSFAQNPARVSVDTSAGNPNGPSGGQGIAISADGRHVAFSSDASDLVSSDTPTGQNRNPQG